jgi:hypothetical protein
MPPGNGWQLCIRLLIQDAAGLPRRHHFWALLAKLAKFFALRDTAATKHRSDQTYGAAYKLHQTSLTPSVISHMCSPRPMARYVQSLKRSVMTCTLTRSLVLTPVLSCYVLPGVICRVTAAGGHAAGRHPIVQLLQLLLGKLVVCQLQSIQQQVSWSAECNRASATSRLLLS